MKTEFPILYHQGKKGEIRVLTVWAEDDKVCTKYGIKDGAMQTSAYTAEAKNVGRANATTAEAQAKFEAESLWKEKKRKKYFESEAEALELKITPMLAKEYKAIVFFDDDFYAQPKLDGLRLLSYWQDGEVKLMSRGNVEYTALVHIKQVLEQTLPKNYILDGEVYIHGTGFQTLTSLTKKLREGTETLEYHLYDVALRDDPSANFATRYGKLEAWQRSFNVACLKLVETTVHAAQDVLKIAAIESKWVEKGYEGAIIRPKAGKYEYGFRSNTLLKVKTFSDAEFEVVNVIEGKGKFEGKACFICKNDLTDSTFECTMATTMEEKAQQFQNKEKYIGKKLTVKFFGRTDEQIPRFPTGKAFRITEDLS